MSVLSARSAGRLASLLALAPAVMVVAPTSASAAQLAAISRAPGSIDVFQRDPSSGQLRETTYRAATRTWSPWMRRGGALAPGTDLSAVSRDGGRLVDVFFRDTAGLIQRESFDGTSWSRPVTVSARPATGGPSAVVSGTAVQIFARDRSTGTLIRHTWSPATASVTTTSSKVSLAAGSAPAVDSADGKVAQVTTIAPKSARPQVSRLSLRSNGLGSVASLRSPLSPSILGSPAVTALSAGGFVVTGRGKSGTLARVTRGRTDARWPTTWSSILAPPTGRATALAAPATVAYRATASAPESVLAFLPGTNGRDLQEFVPREGWFTISPSIVALSEQSPGVVASGSAAAPAAAPTPTPTPTPGPTPTPTPTPPTPIPTTPPPPVGPSANGPEPVPAGTIRYFGRTSNDAVWDNWLTRDNTPLANRQWLLSKAWRLEMFTPFSDAATTWFPGGMVYYPLYSIAQQTIVDHPDWVLEDVDGEALHAADGSTPHVSPAGNIFNAGYRQYQVNRLLAAVAAGGYRGLWLDNVNLEMSDSGLVRQIHQVPDTSTPDPNDLRWTFPESVVGALSGADPNGGYNGKAFAPAGSVFPSGENCTGGTVQAGQEREITDSCWAVAVAAMVKQVRASLPTSKELLVNVPWYRFERNVETYGFIDDTSGVNAGRPKGGLPTVPGQTVIDAATYADFEGSFWGHADASGLGPGGNNDLAGHSDAEYSMDGIMRWIDGVHARGKGVIVDNQIAIDMKQLTQPTSSNPDVIATDPDTPLRINEYNLAGELLISNGLDGVGDFNQTDVNWQKITGTGGTGLFDMDLGDATTRPAGTQGVPLGSPTGRGVAAVGSIGNRLWVRAFVRKDGKHAFVLLAEPGTGTDNLDGAGLKYTLPATGCTDMTRSASQPPDYRVLNTSKNTITLFPRSAAFVLCN